MASFIEKNFRGAGDTRLGDIHKINDAMQIELRPLQDADVPLVRLWMEQPHVKKWFHRPKNWIREIRGRKGEYCFIRHRIVLLEGVPIGFCQYYDCYDAKEEWYSVSADGKTFSIDYLIGVKDCLRKGFGRQIVNALVREITEEAHAEKIVVCPESENEISIKTLLSAGFRYEAEQGYYIKEIEREITNSGE